MAFRYDYLRLLTILDSPQYEPFKYAKAFDSLKQYDNSLPYSICFAFKDARLDFEERRKRMGGDKISEPHDHDHIRSIRLYHTHLLVQLFTWPEFIFYRTDRFLYGVKHFFFK